MDKNSTGLREQEAPEKNTDNAFVKVGEDGSPQIPESAVQGKTEQQQGEEDAENGHS